MADLFGIRPWEMEKLRVGELNACDRYLARLEQQRSG